MEPPRARSFARVYGLTSVYVIVQGGKNRRRGKNENEDEKRELVFKEEGQGEDSTTVRQAEKPGD